MREVTEGNYKRFSLSLCIPKWVEIIYDKNSYFDTPTFLHNFYSQFVQVNHFQKVPFIYIIYRRS